MRACITIFTFLWSAQCAVASFQLDFAGFANGNERGYGFGDQVNVDGVNVDLFAWNTTTASPTADGSLLSNAGIFTPGGALVADGNGNFTNGPYAYMDSGNAGLGVGQNLNAGLQVVPSNDDNVGVGNAPNVREVVGLQFQIDITLEQFTFRDLNHNLLPQNSLIDITFDDGSNWTQFSIGAGGILDLPDFLVASSDRIGLAYVDTQFYLSTLEADPVIPTTTQSIPEASSLIVWGMLALVSGQRLRRRRPTFSL